MGVYMKQATTVLSFQTVGRTLGDITGAVRDWQRKTGIREGLLTLLCRHTSASLLIQENAAPEVHIDIAAWFDRLAPESNAYVHDDEGADDMPAHLRAILTGVSLQIPVMEGEMALGTWQAIYLAEHRRRSHHREVALHILGE